MHTGILSLMQMTRMTLACSELKKNKVPFIVVAGGPCLGGTTASMASLADIILSESKDLPNRRFINNSGNLKHKFYQVFLLSVT